MKFMSTLSSMRFWKLLGIVLLSYLIPELAFAADPAGDVLNQIRGVTGAGFTPTPEDVSVKYLGAIFGQVGEVLVVPGSNLAGTIFKTFNHAILVLGGLIAAYTIVVGTLYSAHEGQFLGQKWHSTMVPVRGVMGIAFLLPLPSGYSVLQVVTMWIVMQGIGAADMLWSNVLTASVDQGIAFNVDSCAVFPSSCSGPQRPTGVEAMTMTGGTGAAMQQAMSSLTSMFEGLVCMQAVNRYNNAPYMKNVQIPPPQAYLEGGEYKLDFKTQALEQSGEATANCGTLTWSSADAPATGGIPAGTPGFGRTLFEYSPTVLNMLNNLAYKMVHAEDLSGGIGPDGNPVDYSSYLQQLNYAVGLPGELRNGTYIIGDASQVVSSGLAEIYNVFNAFYSPIETRAKEYENIKTRYDDKDRFLELAKPGWALAGSYYLALAAVANEQNVMLQAGDTALNGNINLTAKNNQSGQAVKLTSETKIKDIISMASNFKNAILFTIIVRNTTQWDAKNIPKLDGGGEGFSMVKTALDKITRGLLDAFPPEGGGNPVVKLIKAGSIVISTVGAVLLFLWIGGTALLAIMSTIVLGNGVPILGNIVTSLVIGPLFLVLLVLTGLAVTVTIYIPLIPYINYTMGVISWIIAVIESIVAGPIVAVGMMYPEADGLMGKSGRALMMILNLFLRPILMLVGLLFSLLLTYLALDILRVTFFIPASLIQGNSWFGGGGGNIGKEIGHAVGGFMGGFIQAIALVCIYVSLVVFVCNKCFSLIYQLPDGILRWLGGGNEFGNAGEMAQGATQEAKGVSDSAGKQLTSGAAKAGSKIASAAQSGSKEQKMAKAAEAAKKANKSKQETQSAKTGTGEESSNSSSSDSDSSDSGSDGDSGGDGDGGASPSPMLEGGSSSDDGGDLGGGGAAGGGAAGAAGAAGGGGG